MNMETYATLIYMRCNFHKKNRVHDFDISTSIHYYCVINSIFIIFSQNKITLTKCNKCKITITPVCTSDNSSVFLQRGRCEAIPVCDTSKISVGTNIAVA